MIELLHEIEASRGVPVATLCEAIEEALPAAYAQHAGSGDVLATVDRETATIALHRRFTVVDGEPDPRFEIARAAVPAKYEPGDYFFEPVDLADFGRIAALTAKRVIAQRVLEHEREAVFQKYRPLQGTIVRGLVQREIHGSLYVVFEDGHEAVLPRSERGPRDSFAINDVVDAVLHLVAKTPRGPALILSRSRASYIRGLFGEGVLAAARRPGFVTYLAAIGWADTSPARIAEIAATIGERVQIIRWSDDPAEMVVQLLPAGAGEAFWLVEHGIVIVEGDEITDLQLVLAAELVGMPVLPARPGESDVVLERHLAAVTAAVPPAADVAIDPELVRKLEEFRAEREHGKAT